MKNPVQNRLTWRKAALRVAAALFAGILLGIGLISQGIFLSPSQFQFSGLFYMAVALAPGSLVFILCALKRPSGSRLWPILLPILGAVLFIFYLALIGPCFYASIQCAPPTGSGPLLHQQCTCATQESSTGIQKQCVVDSLAGLPLIRLSVP